MIRNYQFSSEFNKHKQIMKLIKLHLGHIHRVDVVVVLIKGDLIRVVHCLAEEDM